MSAVPRVVVSAPSSGHGKTALAVGLLAAFAGRGLSAVGFKVGPDHTDAAYLGAAAGTPGRNLDPRLVGAHRVAPLFANAAEGHDIAVVEGTMGLFDSLAGRVETDSTAGVAAALRAPVVMVVDVGAMGQSVAALVHGFRAYDELTWLGGVILNRVASDRHEQLLREALDDIGVPVYGALRRRDLPSTLPPRHEGVVPVLHREVEALRGIRRLGESISGAVDLDGLLALAHSAPTLPTTPWSPASELALAPDDTAAVLVGRRPIVALAGGAGLSFAYAETRELLEAAGATVVPVDPLRDELLPKGTDALVVGGALPEAYAEELSANRRLCADVADLARSGRPVIAEGAGLLWLAQAFDGRPMCGVLDATGTTGDQMIVGYRDATARATTAVAEIGARVVGYKQHRGVVSPRAGQTPAWTWNGGTPEGFVWRRVHASQLSLHWAGFPEIARRLVLAARPGDGPSPGGGSWAQATGAVPVVAGPLTRDEGGALDHGVPGLEDAPRLPAGAGPAATADAPSAAGPPRLRVVPPPADDDDPTDGHGFDGVEQTTDGFGFAGVPGARVPMGDGYAYVVPPRDEQAPSPRPAPSPPHARRGEPGRPSGVEFGFPLGRGGRPAAGSGFGPVRPGGQPSRVPPSVGPASAVPAGGFGPGSVAGPASGIPADGGFAASGPPGGFGPFELAGQPSAIPAPDGGGFRPVGASSPLPPGFPGPMSAIPADGGGYGASGAAGPPLPVSADGGGYGPAGSLTSGGPLGGGFASQAFDGQPSRGLAHEGGYRPSDRPSAMPPGGGNPTGPPGPLPPRVVHGGAFASPVPADQSAPFPPGRGGQGAAGQPPAVPAPDRGYGPRRPAGDIPPGRGHSGGVAPHGSGGGPITGTAGQPSRIQAPDGGHGPLRPPGDIPPGQGRSGGVAPHGRGGEPTPGPAGQPPAIPAPDSGHGPPRPAGDIPPSPGHSGGFTPHGPSAEPTPGPAGPIPAPGSRYGPPRPAGDIPPGRGHSGGFTPRGPGGEPNPGPAGQPTAIPTPGTGTRPGQAGGIPPGQGHDGEVGARGPGGRAVAGSVGGGQIGVPRQQLGDGDSSVDRPGGGRGAAPVTDGRATAPAHRGETLSAGAAADGALAGGTAEVPALPVRPPRGRGGGGQLRDEDGGIV